jgi:hypothetical protein
MNREQKSSLYEVAIAVIVAIVFCMYLGIL